MKKKLKVKSNNNKLLTRIAAPFKNKNNQLAFGSFLFLLACYLLIAFSSFYVEWKSDNSIVMNSGMLEVLTHSDIKNSLGGLGAYLSHLLIYKLFGVSAYLIFIFTLFLSLRVFGYKKISISNLLFYCLIFLLYFPIFIFHFFTSSILSGGLGIYSEKLLSSILGEIGTTLLLITLFILYFFINHKPLLEEIFRYIKEFSAEAFNILSKKIHKSVVSTNDKTETVINKDIITEENFVKEKRDAEDILNSSINEKINTEINKEETEEEVDDDTLDIEIKKVNSEEKLSETEIEKKLRELGDYDPTLELSSFKMPSIDLLNSHGASEIKIDKEDLEEKKNKIVETLGHYKIGITSISATVGPTITLYEIVPEAGVRISKIKNLEDDIALSLAAEGIRIIAPIPGKGTIGIEVPNKTKNIVSMQEVLSSEKFLNNKMALPIAFGKTISNETYVVDLAKMPHLLMAGATGQGKSVGLNAVLASLLYKKHPSQVKFVLIDPKKVELTLFNKIERHYLAKLPDEEDAIITDTKKVVNTVNSLCIEMDDRYELCKNANCRNIIEYNKKFISRKLNPNDGHRFLPYIVLVIDEFADLIMTAGKEIETPIARLAQLARAIGIHLIIATQRPSVNVITGLIKANFPARVAFRVTSTTDSRTIMDAKGAEQLIGMGDMLISTGSELIRLQCAFIDTPEVEKICEYIGSQRAYPQAHILPEYEGEAETVSTKADLNDKDAMFDEAARTVVQSQSGSTSLIQRKLRLGYNRAGRIIDQLESAGIVGAFEGSKARKVLVRDMLELEELLNKLNQNE